MGGSIVDEVTGPATSLPTPAPGARQRALGRAGVALAGVLVPYVAALLLWIVAAPRSELLSVGEGRGVRLPDAGADGGSQLLVLVLLLGFAAVCSALALWRCVPRLRRPGGVAVLAVLPGLVCAAAAGVASPLARVVASPPGDVQYGEVVLQAPAVGELFFDQMIYGSSGPSWDLLPPGAGWFVWGAMLALFTVAALAHFSPSPDLRTD